MTAVAELVIAAPVEPWARVGLHVVDGRARVAGVVLRFVAGDSGVVAWGLAAGPDSLAAISDIDGLATHVVEYEAAMPPAGRDDIVGFDHIVVMTSSLERTCAAIEGATGEPLKRIREAGPVRQGFHRLGEVIVEVVESAQMTAPTASFWGFVWNVADIDEWCGRLGPDVVSLPRPAVQPGRRIATVRREIGLCLPLAAMTPPPARP
jgi:hypothetical protein